MPSEIDVQVKLAIYGHFAETGRRSEVRELSRGTGVGEGEVLAALQSLRAQRLLLLEADGRSIRMAPPFSGVPTQHRVDVDGREYFANCAWDALGIVAALRRAGRVRSRCEQSHEPLDLAVRLHGPEPSDWLFHCLVPAAHWWDDLVFT